MSHSGFIKHKGRFVTEQDHLERINALTRNARAAWFAMLATLVFVTITLMSLKHIDFYGVGRATLLPVLNVSVPTRYFFVAAPILIASIYGHFHLHLIRLWDALGAAPTQVNDIRLGDAVTPWLVTDAALHLRARLRGDSAATPRVLDGVAMTLNLMLVWIAGLAVLFSLWFLSMPAHSFWMTGLAAFTFGISLIAGMASLGAMVIRLHTADQTHNTDFFDTLPAKCCLLVGFTFMLALSYQRTEGSANLLAPVNLFGENIAQRPLGWLPHDIAKAEFRAQWCTREGVEKDCRDLGDRETEFNAEFVTRRKTTLDDTSRPDWNTSGHDKPDLRNAQLSGSFLAGSNLARAQMQGADLTGAQLEGADLTGAQLQGAVLVRAQLQGANLVQAQFQGADLTGAQLQDAVLKGAQLQGANLRIANIRRAYLRNANLQGAVLRAAQLEGADLTEAQLKGAVLEAAKMQGAKLWFAHLQEAKLSGAQLQGAYLRKAQLQNAVLEHTNLQGANLSGANMQKAHLLGALMQEANLSGANMQGAVLAGAQMQGANLTGAQMQGANLLRAKMQKASLSKVQFQGANLVETQMQEARLSFSTIAGSETRINLLKDTNLSKIENIGGLLRFVDLSPAVFDAGTDFRTTFLDGSVIMTEEFREQMGHPCQWADAVITDDVVFYGRWRGWLEASPPQLRFKELWSDIAPREYVDVVPIPPPLGCTWKTSTMPRSEAK